MNITLLTRASRKRDVLSKLLKLFATELNLDRRTNFNLEVQTLSGFAKQHGAYGGIYVDGHNILLALDSELSKFRLIEVLAHEMVHVQQVVQWRLRYVGDRTLWCGIDHTDTPYDDRPWEIDAQHRTPQLLKRLCEVLA